MTFACHFNYCKLFHYLHQGAVIPGVCLSVCLSVCLWATSRKNYRSDFHENFTRDIYLWTTKKWLNFVSHPLPDLDVGIFWRTLQHCEIRHFYTFWLIFLEKLIGSSGKFHHRFIFGQGDWLTDLVPWRCSCGDTQRQLGYGSSPGVSVLGKMNRVVYSQAHVSLTVHDAIHLAQDRDAWTR